MTIKFLILVLTLATSPQSEHRVVMEADRCMQWNRDYWAMKKFGGVYQFDFKDGRPLVDIEAMACVDADPQTYGVS